jgi:signal transduction histidine kinase
MKEIDQHSAFSETEFESHLQDSRAFVCIEFSDDGPGIPDDVIADIFNPFFTTKPAGKGTGLGLSICRTIIERHQGNMLVKSKVGQGTTFIVVLPAAVKVE